MRRIATPTRQQNKYGPGRDAFTDGNQTTGVSSTQLEALFFDNVQEEIARAIELSGGVLGDPLEPDFRQLYEAIQRIAEAAGGGGGPPSGGPFLPLIGGTLYRAGASDPLNIVADANQTVRIHFEAIGRTTWAAGVGIGGQFNVSNVTAGDPAIFTVRNDNNVVVQLGDLFLNRTDQAHGWILRPDVPGARSLGVAVAGGANLDAFNVSAAIGHFTGNIQVVGNVNATHAGFIGDVTARTVTAGNVITEGPDAIYWFADRVIGNRWGWYADNGVCALVAPGGNVMTIDLGGSVHSVGNLSTAGAIWQGTATPRGGMISAQQLWVEGGTTVAGLTASGVTTAFLQVNETSSFNGEAVFNTNARVLGALTAGALTCQTNGSVAGNWAMGTFSCITSGSVDGNMLVLGTLNASAVIVGGVITADGQIGAAGVNTVDDINVNGNLWCADLRPNRGEIVARAITCIQDLAFKPGGGPWDNMSDIRIKRDISDFTLGLDAVRQLRPRLYRFNGLAGITTTEEFFEGLIADEVLPVVPELMRTHRAKLNADDLDETDLLSVKLNPLTYMLINAVKELAARVEALEAATTH